MVEIRYGEHYDVAELGGETVAEARSRYEAKFGMPNRAHARVNGKGIAKRHEDKTEIGANDRIVFAEKSRKGLIFVGAILIALLVSGGVFAFTATSTTVTLGLTKKNEFASVPQAGTPPTWNVWGHYKGQMTAGELYKITPEAAYTGDLSVMVTLANGHDLVKAYRTLVFEISVYEDAGAGTAADTSKQLGTTEYLTMGKGEATIDLTSLSGKTAPFWVYLDSGFYFTHHTWTDAEEDPILLCDVAQKGVM